MYMLYIICVYTYIFGASHENLTNGQFALCLVKFNAEKLCQRFPSICRTDKTQIDIFN